MRSTTSGSVWLRGIRSIESRSSVLIPHFRSLFHRRMLASCSTRETNRSAGGAGLATVGCSSSGPRGTGRRLSIPADYPVALHAATASRGVHVELGHFMLDGGALSLLRVRPRRPRWARSASWSAPRRLVLREEVEKRTARSVHLPASANTFPGVAPDGLVAPRSAKYP